MLFEGRPHLQAPKHIKNLEEIFVNCGNDHAVMMGWERRVVTTDVDGRDTIVYEAIA